MVACGAIGMTGGGMTPRPRGGGAGETLVVATRSLLPTPVPDGTLAFVQDEKRAVQYVETVNTSLGPISWGRWIGAEIAGAINSTTGFLEDASGKPGLYMRGETLADIIGATGRNVVDGSVSPSSVTDAAGGGIEFYYEDGSGTTPLLTWTPASVPDRFAIVMSLDQTQGNAASNAAIDFILDDNTRLARIGSSVGSVSNQAGVLRSFSTPGVGAISTSIDTVLEFDVSNNASNGNVLMLGSGFPKDAGGSSGAKYSDLQSSVFGLIWRIIINDIAAQDDTTVIVRDWALLNLT